MTNENSIHALIAVGFTSMEAEIYLFLLQESPVTGYRVAQALGKPAANIYKALESLEHKGAVLVDHGRSRLCRATPPEELLGLLDRNFQERRSQASRVLAELRGMPHDDRVYRLRSREQVFERCRSMLARCKHLALFDICPDPLEHLRSAIEATTARGVQVTAKVFLPDEVHGADVVLNPRGQEVMSRYPGQWVILLVDGAEMLMASLDPNGKDVQQAIWTGSETLSWLFHTAFAAEIIMSLLMNHINRGATLAELQAAVAPFSREGARIDRENTAEVVVALARCGICFSPELPGFEALVKRFREGAGSDLLSSALTQDLSSPRIGGQGA